MRSSLLALLLVGCSGSFWGNGKNPNAADADTDTDTDSDTDSDTDTDTDTDTDSGTDSADVDDDGDGVTENEGDCDDTDGGVSPSATETPYNGVDDDCDPATADDDLDGDGYGSTALGGDDCDDAKSSVSPGVAEVPYNGIDDDCDANTADDDLDGDGHGSTSLGGDDCDDTVASTNPDAAENTKDAVDNDCDGDIDERFEVGTLSDSDDVGNPSAIGVDSTGLAHVVYRNDDFGTLHYTTFDGSSFSAAIEIVSDSDVGESLDLVVDSADELQIAYTWSSGGYTDLWFGYMDGRGTWDTGYLVDGYSESGSTSTGQYVSIAVDSSNLPSFAYMDSDYLVPVLADYTSFGVAIYTDIDVLWYWTYGTGYFTTLAIDSDDYDHVAWFDDNLLGSEAQYSDFNESTVNETIADDGWYTSLALQSDDTACVAYQDSVKADLIYACRNASSQTWSPATVDSSGAVGSYAQLAFDSTNQPWIAYYDESNGNLKVAAKISGAWSVWTVDETGDVGVAPSIAIAADDTVYVSYYDATNGALKVAMSNG
jgi:hypothetical protein